MRSVKTTFVATALLLVCVMLAACSGRDDSAPVASATAPPPTAAPTSPPSNPAARATNLDPDRLLGHAQVLSEEIGPRVAGTAGANAAVDYIAAEFERYGYEVSVDEFTFEGNRFTPGSIVAGEVEIEGLSLAGSAAGEASGPLVFAGLGGDDALAETDVEGRIVVVDRGEIRFGQQYEEAASRGAAGLVIVNNEAGELVGGQLGTEAAIPVVGIASVHRDALLSATEGDLEATIRAWGTESSARNVVARAPRTERCLLLVGGHHDTVPDTPGANDNASGVAHVLELARAMADDGLDPGLCFATFGAEESGLFGSRALVADFESAGMLPEVMVNFDVTGRGRTVEAIGTDRLVARSIELGDEIGVDVVRSSLPPNTGSDHLSFTEAGVAVLFLGAGNYDEIHTPQDTFDELEPDAMEAVGEAGFAFVRDLYAALADGE